MAEGNRTDIMAHSSAEDLAADQPEWMPQRLGWFQGLKFGLMVHWGIYSQWGCIESWPLSPDAPWARPDDLQPWLDCGQDLPRFREAYWKLSESFNPTGFDPDVWADDAARAGMRYVCFTTKHHDGFSMFDTRQTNYRATDPHCPLSQHPRADAARAVFDAFRARDFAVSCYFSKPDWHHPDYWAPDAEPEDRNPTYDPSAEPQRWERFVQFTHRQIEELMRDYGPIDLLWLDGGWVRPPKQDIRMDEIAAMARSHQPELLIADRTVGGAHENILTPEQQIPEKPLGHPWESCLTMGPGWSYRFDDEQKPTGQLIAMLCETVAKGGNFLLNVAPGPDGRFPPNARARLHELGKWMDVCGEAIHGTEAIPPYEEGTVRFTRKAERVHALVLADEQGEPPSTVTLNALRPADGSDVELLGRDEPLPWEPTGDGARVTLPAKKALPCAHAWALRFTPR
jgi:alpha-L-fucosidase